MKIVAVPAYNVREVQDINRLNKTYLKILEMPYVTKLSTIFQNGGQ